MRILIADDDEIALELLENALVEAGHEVTTARDGEEAFQRLRSGLYRLVISDWEMPRMNGLELCRAIRSRGFGDYTYVVLLTAHSGADDVVEGLSAGADDFMTKPFRAAELCVRIRAAQRLLSLESRNMTIFAMAKLADSRDPETGAHLERMREYCRILAGQLAINEKYRDVVDGEYVQLLYMTSPLHDIGKVGVPDSVLLKCGRLTDREFEIMKTHTTIGAETLEAAIREYPDARFLHMARDIALTHHEQFDGSGYPQGLAGEEIPLCGRIVALADVYDALTTKRCYKAAFSHDIARSIILEGTGKHFDPDIVDAFLLSEDEFRSVQRGLSNRESLRDETGSPRPLEASV